MTFPLSHHISRHPMRCKIQSRAIEGAFAAERLADVKQAHFAELADYQEIERIYWEAGPNLRAVIHDHWVQAKAIASKRFRDYRAAVAAEHIAIEIERKAA
jgi:hypothetical protein|tara:strand:- start:221 stop:523 length:303 start_codon:yes stop_codon:yes gene_type:complete